MNLELLIYYIMSGIIVFYLSKTILKIMNFEPGNNILFQNKFFVLAGGKKNVKKIKKFNQKMVGFIIYYEIIGDKIVMVNFEEGMAKLSENERKYLKIKHKMISEFNDLFKNISDKFLSIHENHMYLEDSLDKFNEMDEILTKTGLLYKIPEANFSFYKEAENVIYTYYQNMLCLTCKEKWCLNLGNVKRTDMADFKPDLFHMIKYHPVMDTYSFTCWNKHIAIKSLPVLPEFNVCPLCKKEICKSVLLDTQSFKIV